MIVRRCLHCMKEFQIEDQYKDYQFNCPYCGYLEMSPPKELYHLYPGTILQGRYIVGTVIGFGGFGVTYKAWDETLSTIVAIKEYYPAGTVQRTPGESNVIVYDGVRKKEFYAGLTRFMEEARIVAKFSNPNIVSVNGYFEENNTAYMVMEYLDGVTLKGYLKQENGRIKSDLAVEIICSVIDALRDVHAAGILHRDLSPDNIFLCEGGKVKLLDFGASRLSDEEKEVTRSIILKPGFAPPEQYQSKSKQGPWTDIYALAATMYRVVTGVVPDESTNRLIEDEVVQPKDIYADIPEYISNSIMKGMALTPELRFKNVDEFRDALQNKVKVLEVKEELKRRQIRRIVSISAAGVALIGGVVAAVSIYHSKKQMSILDPANVVVWMSVDEGEDADQLKKMVEDMSSQFLTDQQAVTVQVECIPGEEYTQRLVQAMNDGTMPTIYESNDKVPEALVANSKDMKGVFKYLNNYTDLNDTCYFLSNYEKILAAGNRMPLGFNAPVAYVRRNDAIDLNTVTVSSYAQLSDETSSGYYISTKYGEMIDTSLGIQPSDNHGEGDDESAMTQFVDGEITYYVSSALELRDFNNQAAGIYEMRPLSTEVIEGEFVDYFGIYGGAKKDEEIAAEMFLYYMLLDGPQKVMHVSNKNALPLNKSAYQQLVDNNGKYEVISGYLDKMDFEETIK